MTAARQADPDEPVTVLAAVDDAGGLDNPPDPPDQDPPGGPGATLTRIGLQTFHSRDCWTHHPTCALIAARDLQMMRRDHAAGQVERYRAAIHRAARVATEGRADAVREELSAARRMLRSRDDQLTAPRAQGATR